MSPVARWHRQCSFFRTGDCVPLPQPGGPGHGCSVRFQCCNSTEAASGAITGGGAAGGNGTDQYEPLLGLQLAIQPPLHLRKEVIHADFAEIRAGCGHVVKPELRLRRSQCRTRRSGSVDAISCLTAPGMRATSYLSVADLTVAVTAVWVSEPHNSLIGVLLQCLLAVTCGGRLSC